MSLQINYIVEPDITLKYNKTGLKAIIPDLKGVVSVKLENFVSF